jgi:hypothetical protein
MIAGPKAGEKTKARPFVRARNQLIGPVEPAFLRHGVVIPGCRPERFLTLPLNAASLILLGAEPVPM